MSSHNPGALLGALLALLALTAPVTGQATVYSSGCSGLGSAPTVTHSGTIAPGYSNTVSLGGAPANALFILFVGTLNEGLDGEVLDIPLDGVPGMNPGCSLNTDFFYTFVGNADVNGDFDFTFGMKTSLGEDLNFQFAVYEQLDPLSIVMSEALNIHIPLVADPDQASLDFGTLRTGLTSSPQSVVFTNNTVNPMTIDDAVVFDTDASDFSATLQGVPPIVLNPGQTVTVDVDFGPNGIGPRNAVLELVHAGLPGGFSNTMVPLSGIGMGPPNGEYLISAGHVDDYLDSTFQTWSEDFGVTGGTLRLMMSPVTGTPDPDLYESYRTGASFAYALEVPDGNYEVTLHFADEFAPGPGVRVFDVSAEGVLMIDDLDVVAEVGTLTPHVESFLVPVSDGTLDLDFVASVGVAELSAIEVRSIFPVLSISPPSHDFGSLPEGSGDSVALTLTNTGTDTLSLDTIDFLVNDGHAHDFNLDLNGSNYQGALMGDVSHPATLVLAQGANIGATLNFDVTEHDENDITVRFAGNFDTVDLPVLGNGASGSHPFLHVVIEPVGVVVDYDNDGSEIVSLDGTFSHTHEPGKNLTTFEWTEGPTVLGTNDTAAGSFALGPHTVCLEIGDDNVPQELLSDCIDFDVVPPTAVPGVLAQYFDTGRSTPPATLIDTPPSDPDFTETRPDFSVPSGGTIGGSLLSDNVLVRLRGSVDVTVADTYEFSATGGVDQRLFIDAAAYTVPLFLGTGTHTVEAWFAVNTPLDLPVEVLMGPSGGSLASIDAGVLTHDQTLDPPIIHTMTENGSTLGGNLVVIDGFGFFPDSSVIVHWGATDLTLLDGLAIANEQISFTAPPHSAGLISVTVESPQGTSNARTFEYLLDAPPPIDFTLKDTAVSIWPEKPIASCWGADGRLYVGTETGKVFGVTFDENYNGTKVEYDGVSNSPDFTILGMASNPFDPASPVRIYVAHSALFAHNGGLGPLVAPAPFNGKVSVLEGPDFDTPIPYITGLPTSNHDHGVNGIIFDNNGDLLICMGGNTDSGVKDAAFGGMDESPLSGAILKAATSRPDFDGAVTYVDSAPPHDPVDDQRFGETIDVASGSHVTVHAPGVRNSLDAVLTTWGYLYATDNGPNSGYGASAEGLTNDGPDVAHADELLHIEPGVYYGFPNRSRGRYDDRQNFYRDLTEAEIPGEWRQKIKTLNSSSNGIVEYRATTFQEQMRDQLLVQRWKGPTTRVELSADKRTVVSSATDLGPANDALGLQTAPGGVVLGMKYQGQKVNALIPNDVSAVGVTAFDIHPWRAPSGGGAEFVIGGVNFGTLGNTTVTIGGITATLSSVTSTRITGTVPPNPSPTTDLLDVVVTSNSEISTISEGFRYLFATPGNEPGFWRDELPPMPVALGEVASAVIDGVLYVVGEGSSATLAYDIPAGTWSSSLATRSFPGDHHAAEVHDGKLFLFGGLSGGAAGKVQIYDPMLDTWTSGTDMPWAGGSVNTALIDGLIYVSGGIVSGSTVVNTAAYDPALDSWSAPLANMVDGRNHAAAGTDGTLFYVFGGRGPGSGDSNTVANGFADVQIYDPVADTWESSNDVGSTLAPLPIGRGGTGKALYDRGRFYVFGGETLTGPGAVAGNVYDRVDVYDVESNTWSLDAPMPTPRHGTFPVLFEGRVFLAGGGIVAGNSQVTDADWYTRP